MVDYKSYLKGKKVTLMRIGLLGRGVGDAAFLAECGAQILVVDDASQKVMQPSVDKLKKYKNIRFKFGKYDLKDFRNCDFVLKGAGTPFNSPEIAEAKKNNIPVEMDESLFAKLAPDVKIIGITGTRGKSTTTVLIYEILKQAGLSVHLGGNIKGAAALPLLKEVKAGDIVVFELSSWQLQGFGEAKISPSVSVFTNFMPDHMNYYKNDLKQYFGDKSYIYKFQKKEDVLVLGPAMKNKIKDAKSKIVNANIKNIPKSWKIKLVGKHNLENIACAVEVARALKIKEQVIKKAVENFKGVEGRMELVREVKGVKIYNDTNSCTPEATSAALRALGKKSRVTGSRPKASGKNIILIMGGTDKNLELKNLAKDIPKYTKALILLPGNGTDRMMKENSRLKNHRVDSLKDAVEKSLGLASVGDMLILSPGFTSFGMFQNEYDRGEKFMQIINKLK